MNIYEYYVEFYVYPEFEGDKTFYKKMLQYKHETTANEIELDLIDRGYNVKSISSYYLNDTIKM